MPMSLALDDAFGKVMFAVPTHVIPSAAGAFGWLAMLLTVSVFACAWPALRATRVPAAVALSYE